jgi:hypothetical protein
MASALDRANDNGHHQPVPHGLEILWLRVHHAHAPISADQPIGGQHDGSFVQEVSAR